MQRKGERTGETGLNMFLINNCSKGETLTAGTGHSEMWSEERNQVSCLPEGKTLAVPHRHRMQTQVLKIQGNIGLEFIDIRGERLRSVQNLALESSIALPSWSNGTFSVPEEGIKNDYDISNHSKQQANPPSLDSNSREGWALTFASFKSVQLPASLPLSLPLSSSLPLLLPSA